MFAATSVPGRVGHASFQLRRGEILGFAGLVGAGRTELMEGIAGLRTAHGEVTVEGRTVRIRSLEQASRLGLAYLTEDRKGHGLLLNQTMRPNLTLLDLARFSHILIDEKAEDAALDKAIHEFDIRAPNRDVQFLITQLLRDKADLSLFIQNDGGTNGKVNLL